MVVVSLVLGMYYELQIIDKDFECCESLHELCVVNPYMSYEEQIFKLILNLNF